MQWHRGGTKKAPLSSERNEKMRSRHLRWMETTGMSPNRWSWCVYVAHLRPVWSKETEVCFCCFVPSWLFIEAQSNSVRSGPVWQMWVKLVLFFRAITFSAIFGDDSLKGLHPFWNQSFPNSVMSSKWSDVKLWFRKMTFLRVLFAIHKNLYWIFRAAGGRWAICWTRQFSAAFFVLLF